MPAVVDPFAAFRQALEELSAAINRYRPIEPFLGPRLGAPITGFWFDESGLYRPAKRPPLIHNGRKPRK